MGEDKSLSRKGFFGELFGLVRKGVTHHVEHEIAKRLDAPLRPPGALDEVEFLSVCTRCNACSEVCPYLAILRFPLDAGLSAGTPYIEPRSQACQLCPDMPCISACEPGALKPLEGKRPEMGRAGIQQDDCMTYNDSVCTRCYDACPHPEEAITIDAAFHPQILDGCVGCGACEQICPAHPVGVKVYSPLAYRVLRSQEDTYFGVLKVPEEHKES